MDLSTVAAEYGSHKFKLKETFQETDIRGNNDFFNSLKTDSNSNHGHDSSSLFQVKSASANLEVDNSLFSYSSFKKAMDLRTLKRTSEVDPKRTIFEDAELFAKNYRYKLLPITFEQVDETIIQSEHNYSLWSLSSESEPEEDCSRMMDYKQIKEKNYKRRRTKFWEEGEEKLTDGKILELKFSFEKNKCPTIELQERDASPGPPTENSPVQPLDLSAASLVQENKTETLSLQQADIHEIENDEVAQLDSDKENIDGIRVTITRPDEKESYQPCDLFLNDMARLVPWLIDKDCFEVDILDRTCDRRDETRKNRVYYVISEATWGLFQKTNERVILTNDSSLGPPAQKVDKEERPSFLVFDQFSLAKCLAEYCHEIGGCFEYTYFEEKDGEEEERKNQIHEEKENQLEEKIVEQKENVIQKNTGRKNEDKIEEQMIAEVKKNMTEEKIFERKEDKKQQEIAEEKKNVIEKAVIKNKEDKAAKGKNVKKEKYTIENQISIKKMKNKIRKEEMREKIKETKNIKTVKIKKTELEVNEKQNKTSEQKLETKIPKKDSNKKPPKEPEPKKIRKNEKSTSKPETSHKSDKPVFGRKRRKRQSLTEEEPPRKREKLIKSEKFKRKTRSRKLLENPKKKKPKEKKKICRKWEKKKKNFIEEKNEVTRTLRSHKEIKTKEERSLVNNKIKTRKIKKK